MRPNALLLTGVMWLSAAFAPLAAQPAASSVPSVTPRAVVLNDGLKSPWGLAFLPDGRMLVTQKPGSLLLLDATGKRTLATLAVPPVVFRNQGGLLDVAVDPDFAREPWIYWTYSEAGSGAEEGLAGTAVARGRLVGDRLEGIQVIYRQAPKTTGNGHYGARIVFRPDKTMYITLGERQKLDPAQDLDGTLGKVIRLNRDGSVPAGNPGVSKTRPEIWSYGHRNPQGAALRPGSSELWVTEHGPQGGDELNRVQPGRNYGWPKVSYGCPYGAPKGEGCRYGGGTHEPAYEPPVSFWVPTSMAPSGLVFYSGRRFPQWKGDALMGALAGTAVWRVRLDGNREAAREALFGDLRERVRDIREGPEGYLYLLTDSGKLIQIRD
ncbi:MAG: PQQ-dependent sugar dehydrogenase [Gammaproteobacteria bacterium]|jgi:glucose/arabinose dehydrogenase